MQTPLAGKNDVITVAIIGAGFSGSMAAVHLLNRLKCPAGVLLEVLLIERRDTFARGIAYGTLEAGHLLNVQAKGMSAFPDRPGHFVDWASSHGILPQSFAPRRLYGDYLASILEETCSGMRSPARLRKVKGEVVEIRRKENQFALRLRDGTGFDADYAVLALGGFPAGPAGLLPFPVDSSLRVIGAWEGQALAGIEPASRVLVLGSALTMIDTTLTLKARGHRGAIQAISRHGYLPQPFAPVPELPADAEIVSARSLRAIVRAYRRQCEPLRGDWRAVLRSLRPVTPSLWRALTVSDRARFLRHLRSLWDTHRHQMAPEIAEKIALWRRDGSLAVMAARVVGLEREGHAVRAVVRRRGELEVSVLSADCVINCLGLEGNFGKMQHPLVQALRSHGLIRPDTLGLGIDVTGDGRVVDARGVPSSALFALGSLRRGECWESVAVPELREQAAELARVISAGVSPVCPSR